MNVDETTVGELSKTVVKRDGKVVDFDPAKIASAIRRAGSATGDFAADEGSRLAQRLARTLTTRAGADAIQIEEIQDAVELALLHAGHLRAARAYIVYREQHAKLRDRQTLVDVASSINEYLDQQDWRVNANANQGYSLGGLILNVSGKVIANYWLSHVYPPEVGRAHRDGDLHIHDLDMLAGYCAGWSLRTLLTEGSTACRARSRPARRSTCPAPSARSSTSSARCRTNGRARRRSARSTPTWPRSSATTTDLRQVQQCIQELVYNLNVPSRWGTQTPFTNLTFDWTCPEDLRDQVPGHRRRGVRLHLRRSAGRDGHDQPGLYRGHDGRRRQGARLHLPDPHLQHHAGLPLGQSTNAELLFAMTAKYGLPYFQNFLNSDLKPNMVRSMCCRLQLDLSELLKRGNGLFGSAEQTGSLGVVTLNCARLGYLHRGRRGRRCCAGSTRCSSLAARAWRSSARSSSATWTTGCFPTPSAISARCAITSRRSASTASTR